MRPDIAYLFSVKRLRDFRSAVTRQTRNHLNVFRYLLLPISGPRYAVESRGIANIQYIVRAIVVHIKSLGAEAFIVPAMDSHGGGTSEGQREILESHGVTEEFCGCPIRATMETVIVCQASEGFPVHFDKYAHEADHVVLCNRIKTHTQFVGQIESGLMKMMLPGLGKHEGAKIYHRAIKDYSCRGGRNHRKRLLPNCED